MRVPRRRKEAQPTTISGSLANPPIRSSIAAALLTFSIAIPGGAPAACENSKRTSHPDPVSWTDRACDRSMRTCSAEELDATLGYLDALTALDKALGTTPDPWGIEVDGTDDGS